MTALLDTSVLVRYLTGDPPEQAERAAELIDSQAAFVIPIVALSETAYVLETLYGVQRTRVVDVLADLLSRANLSVHDLPTDRAIEALLLCRPSRRVSFADAFIWAAAASTPNGQVYTFDQRFPEQGIERNVL